MPLLRLSLRALATFLQERREPLVLYSAKSHGLTPEEAALRLEKLLSVLQIFDRVELSQRSGAGLATLTLRVRMGVVMMSPRSVSGSRIQWCVGPG